MAAEFGEPVVEVRDLVTRFGAQRVHDRIDLTVHRGEILAIVGGSGSGKSTLLREILLLLRPTSGTIRLFGRDVDGFSEAELLALRRRTGVLFQRDALFSSMTVLANVGVPLREHTALADKVVDRIAAMKIAMVGLEPEAGAKLPSQLSGGMRKRAALARALALDPELLFLDEPTSGLDPPSARELDELVVGLRDSLGLTVVMVTHDPDSLWRAADRVAMLGEGRLVGEGPVDELQRSEHPLVRAFFATTHRGDAAGAAWSPK
ncbi:putative ABC transporter ATP-binding protein [bacterium BMS3Bbin12]|nr:putative ABC transporter ATP-binding protein [bacterium BMS3Abin12]GBE48368.1 putative ABC transporter ATP-binding protein [bacterium BMS3Bbin12]GBE50513.1 putative ABC transporter ATP-binding protein [bacterium BMS3Bbin13]HDJ86408.1 ATP-binding cassette domain-containing protein [Chromatiales bacterium]HDK03397.1 ATP-binding cassette domain-containing protein [Gammaproteobacteria bacterium]